MDGPETETRVLDALGVDRLVNDLARRIAESFVGPEAAPRLVGIHSRGVPLARRLAARIGPQLGAEVQVGALDITLYRDDLDRSARWPVLKGTELPFPVEGAQIVLVDDVLFTGRTIRAALNAICDLGRPARIRLAVAVDRDERELPIQPDFVGLSARARPGERIKLRLGPLDPLDELVRIGPPPGTGSP